MNRQKAIFQLAVTLLLLACTLTGCSRDPKVSRDHFLRSGQQYFDKGQVDAAAIQFRRAVQVDSRYGESYYRLAVAQLSLRQWRDAYKSLNKALELDPAHVPARLELANLKLAARQISDARSEAQMVLDQDPNNLKGQLLLGRISLVEKDYKQALQHFKESQRIAPKNPVSFGEAGDIYLAMNKLSDAKENFEQAISLDANYVPAYLDLAQIYRVQGNTNEQLGTLQNAVRNNPKQVAPYLALASTYLQLGQSNQVTEIFSQFRKATGDAPESLLAIGEFYFASGDLPHSEVALTEGLVKDSHNNSIRRRLIELALTQHDLDKAEKLDDELLKSEPKDSAGRMFKARLQFERGAKATAVTTLEQLVHDVPEIALPHFYLALAYAGEGEANRAIAAMNDTLEHNSNFIWAYLAMGELHLNQGSPKLALESANRALQLSPNFLPAIILQSNAYMQIGDFSSARNGLDKMSEAQPKNPILLERLAVCDINQKQFARAEQRLEAALSAQPHYAQPLVDLIQLYNRQNRPDKIISRLQQQIRQAPSEATLHELLGSAYLAQTDSRNAQQEFEAALKLNPDSTISNLQLARILAAENRVPEAVRIAEQIVQKHPDFFAGWLLLGGLYEQAGNVSLAEQTYQDALRKDGDFVPALNNLAWLLCENGGNLDMALSLAEHAKAKLPNDATISDTLAWIQFRKGLYISALDRFRELTETHPQNPVYRYHLGMTLLKLGKDEEGRQSLSRALSSHLGGDYAAAAKSVLAKVN
jgi:tetratricopeptide (TPR) repeat protein